MRDTCLYRRRAKTLSVMDLSERLKIAGAVKEKGNELFCRGLLEDAQSCYTEVISLLDYDATLAGDQKKDADSLVLAARLNLAECALRLGKYCDALDHCNMALKMDDTSVKAYYRRAKALENQENYDEAVKDYECVLKLEPRNKTAQTQLEKCQKQLERHEVNTPLSQVSDGMKTKDQILREIEYHEMETMSEYEGDIRDDLYQNCTKNPGHKQFLSVKDFTINHLPSCYQDQELFDLLQLQIKLTGLIKVRGSSPHRPSLIGGTDIPYPFSTKKDRKRIRYGSGMLFSIAKQKEGEPCPCVTCKKSAHPKEEWAVLYIQTATHVVFDDIEAKISKVYFCYDTEDRKLDSCPLLSGSDMVEVTSNEKSDHCTVKYICHDKNLISVLDEAWQVYACLSMRVKEKYKTGASFNRTENLPNMFSQLLEKLTKLLAQQFHQKEKFEAIFNGNIVHELLKYLALHAHEEGDEIDGLGHILYNKLNGGDNFKQFLAYITGECEDYLNILKRVECVKDSIQEYLATEEGKQELLDLYSLYFFSATSLEREVDHGKHLLCEDEKDSTAEKMLYDPAHPFTFIVSHPHGCSKKISLGEVTERVSSEYGYFSRYTYTNATCPGSSGASVFILGRGVGFTGHPHSQFGSFDLQTKTQLNESSLDNDV